MTKTRPAPPEPKRSETSVPGTIGFEIYLALHASRLCLIPPKLPSDLGKLVDYRA
jgi:hypothetical protein